MPDGDRCARCGADGGMQANCECALRRALCCQCTFEEHKAAGSACPTECPVCGVEYDGALLFASAYMWMRQVAPEVAHAFPGWLAGRGALPPIGAHGSNNREVRCVSTGPSPALAALAARAKFAYALSVYSIYAPAYTGHATAFFEIVLSDMIRTLDKKDGLHLRTHLYFVAHLGRCGTSERSGARLVEAEFNARILLRACERSAGRSPVNLDLAPAVLARIILNGRGVVVRDADADATRDAEAEALLLRCTGPESARMLAALYTRQGRLAEATVQARVALGTSRRRFGDANEETLRDLERVRAIALRLANDANRRDEVSEALAADDAAPPQIPPTCAMCGSSDPRPKRCAGCRVTRYCGSACQAAHRPDHRGACGASGASGGRGFAPLPSVESS